MAATLDPKLRNGIGASEIAMLFGLSPYGGPLTLYTRLVCPQIAPETVGQRRGKRMERYIAARYADERSLFNFEDGGTYVGDFTGLMPADTARHPEYDFLIASPDYIVYRMGVPQRVLEIKTSRTRAAWEDPAEVPDGAPQHYLLQVAQQMMVGLHGQPIESAHLAACVGHIDDFRVYELARSPKIEAAIIERAGAFWHDHVLPKRPPDFDGSAAGDALLKAMYPTDSRTTLADAGPDAVAVMARLREANAALSVAESRVETERQILRAIIGEGAGIQGPDFKATWKCNKPTLATDWKAVALASGASTALIEKHTQPKPGARVLRTTWSET